MASALALMLAGPRAIQAADPVISDPTATTLGVVLGGDPEDGLDLDGNFPYALSFGADPALEVQVRGATFKGLVNDEVPGASLVAGNTIANWYAINYGDTADDDGLEQATSSIRWSAAGAEISKVTLTLANINVGATYKLQLIFGEQCCNRGFDVLVNGALIVKDFNPGNQHDGIANGTQTALITHTLLATAATLEVVLDGNTASPDYTDHNAIFNAITVEQTGSAGDSDGDGLADAWERLHFDNLSQTASGDPDNDGLTNAEELAASSKPTVADTDGDGLSDSAEVKTHRTNPTNADTDNDKLTDSEEVNNSKSDPTKPDTDGDLLSDFVEFRQANTDPTKPDTDGDGANDYDELRLLKNPTSAQSKPGTTTLGNFTGGDANEGLDLNGTFLYALNIGGDTPLQVRDALFEPLLEAEVVGATLLAANHIPGWFAPVFGDSADDDNLEVVMQSMRWSDAGNADPTRRAVTLQLENLQVGAQYKMQALFAESCCGGRAFDIIVDGAHRVDDFNPSVYQGGVNNLAKGAVITHTFVARAAQWSFIMDGRTVTIPEYTDHNATFSALTLERVAAPADTDNDLLSDAWETEVFGNLSQTGAGDVDSDGLSNAQDFSAGTDPNNADTDGDGLNDGQEVNVAKTNPLHGDTDGDGLSDGSEISVHKTDPTKADTDGDGLPDGLEIVDAGPATTASNILVQSFTGGDPGEGVDLQGTFRYAVNVSSAGAAGKAGDADFTADNVAGVTVIAPNNIPNWDTPEYGDSPADDVLEKVTQSIRYGPNVRVVLANLVPGSLYRLQMFFYEQCCGNRGFNIYVDGGLVAADFSPPAVQGGPNPISMGAMVSVDLETQRDTMAILLTTFGRTNPDLTDPNAILDGFTLEALREVSKPSLTYTKAANGSVTITTDATLQASDNVTGQYQSLAEKTITITPATAGKQRQFYRAIRP